MTDDTETISMVSRSQKKRPRKVSEKVCEFENLLRSAFRALNAQKRPALIKTSVSKRNTKVE